MISRYALLLWTATATIPAFATDTRPPAEFGADWDDPRTAEPKVVRPDIRHCTVEIVRHGFADFEPYRHTFTPPVDCPGPWHKVVLDMEGSVKGRQYDRMGQISVGGVTLLRTSTPEPSREGIRWQVEKDVSAYAPLFTREQPVVMELGNLVNETYTGVFDMRASLTFYPADTTHAPAATAERIVPLDDAHRAGADLVGGFTLPADTNRLVAEVYANGSGGGCEEFWYLSVARKEYSCASELGPYRELQVLIDGKVAGLAAPYPHIYTGGWSNPFLWYTIPAPHTFDLHPQRFELTPFIGLLNDGKPHELRVRVVGLAHDATGWTLLPHLQIWRDPKGVRTRGELTSHVLGEPARNDAFSEENGRTVLRSSGAGELDLAGWIETSEGRRDIEVAYRVGMQSRHDWDKDENDDRLKAAWTDSQRISVRVAGEAAVVDENALTFSLDGGIRTAPEAGNPRLTTDLVIQADASARRQQGDAAASWTKVENRFQGEAAYTQKVPREQRRAIGHSRQDFRMTDSTGACQARRIATVNGYFTEDDSACVH
ncbi:peptide-N4-asparagine amidase [Pseudoxanthomonas beigongshangi]